MVADVSIDGSSIAAAGGAAVGRLGVDFRESFNYGESGVDAEGLAVCVSPQAKSPVACDF